MNNIICARCRTEIGDYQYPINKDHYERTIHGDYAHCVNGLRVELQRYRDALKIAEGVLKECDENFGLLTPKRLDQALAAIQAAKENGK